MRSKFGKNYRKRVSYAKKENYRAHMLFLKNNVFLPLKVRNYGSFFLDDGPFFTVIKDLCIVSGRSRFLVKKFKVSRMVFKKQAGKGIILGLKKSSW